MPLGVPRGQSRTLEQTIDAFFAKTCPEPNTGCLLWSGALKPTKKRNFTYGSAKVISPYDGKMMHQAHRIAWTLTYGPIPEGLWVLHKCDTTLCVEPTHLFLGTAKDNSRDMITKLRSPRGEERYNAKLTEHDVLTIRAMHAADPGRHSLVELSEQFSVHLETIRCIVQRKYGYWNWLLDAPSSSAA